MMRIFEVPQISEEEYIEKLKKMRDIYEKRIAFLEGEIGSKGEGR
jgi:hypothetical protein